MKGEKFIIDINQQNNSVSVMIEKNIPATLEEIKKILYNLPTKDSIKEKNLHHWTKIIYDALFDRNRNETKITDKGGLKYLTKLDKLLSKLDAEVKNMPTEILTSLSELNYFKDTYPQPIPGDRSIANFRYLMNLVKYNSPRFESINKKTKIDDKKGRKENVYNSFLTDHLAMAFFDLTGIRPTRIYDVEKEIETGDYFSFVKEIFRFGGVTASVEDQVRKSAERFLKLYGVNSKK